MSKIPTAGQFLKKKKYPTFTNEGGYGLDCVQEAMIEFAKLHVQSALESASKKARCCEDAIVDIGHTIIDAYVEESSILSSYSLKNIK